MGSKIITISLSDEDAEYLKKDLSLKPSLIFRVALQGIRDNRSNLQETIILLQRKNEILQEKLLKMQETFDTK